MEFCEKCGGMILVTVDKDACASCGHRLKKKPKIIAGETTKQQEGIAVIKEGSDETHPIVEVKCPKCKNKKAYFWTMQTRAGDESETKFYKCTNCKHTWRVYR